MQRPLRAWRGSAVAGKHAGGGSSDGGTVLRGCCSIYCSVDSGRCAG